MCKDTKKIIFYFYLHHFFINKEKNVIFADGKNIQKNLTEYARLR